MGTIPTNYVALTDYLGEHLEAEQGALDAYQRLLDRRSEETDDAVSYLIRTILADEARHHEIFAEILNSLESIVRWEDITPRVPTSRVEVEDRDELLATTDRLLELERDDLKELKALRKAWSKAGGDFQLWALLVETAELDTEKHIRMLEYLRSLVTEADAAS